MDTRAFELIYQQEIKEIYTPLFFCITSQDYEDASIYLKDIKWGR